jgi:hypothetical protein
MPSAVKPFRNERANAIGPREPANDTDLELGDLTVERARGEALAQELDAIHLGLGAASAVISFGAALEPCMDGSRVARGSVIFGNWSGAAMYSASRLRCARAP